MQSHKDYYSTVVHNRECKILFDNYYHFGIHRSELANSGDFRRINAGDRDIILHNDDGTIIAFENSCPHRGCQLIADCQGSQKIVCPYHGWQFSKNKCTIPGKKLFKSTEVDSIYLQTYCIDYCGDFIFFSPEPNMPLKEQIGSYWEMLETISYDITRLIDDNDQPFHANWKVALENALENYHVDAIHSDTLATLEPTEGTVIYDGYNSLWESPLANIKIRNKLSRLQDLFANTYYKESYFSLYLFPFSMISSTFGYSYAFQSFFPKTPSTTAFASRTYGTKTDYTSFFENAAQLNRRIFSEDAHICAQVQEGAKNSTNFIYNQQEQRIVAFHHSYNDALREVIL